MGHWKGKLNDDEMTDAVPALNDLRNRAVADIEAELQRVAQLRSGLPTNVQPGMYASALEALLSSVSSALQLELEHKLPAPGMTGTRRSVLSLRCLSARPPARPPAGVGLAAPHRFTGGRLYTGVCGSSQVCAARPRFPRQARGERNSQSQRTAPPPSPDPIHACMHARHVLSSMPRGRSRTDVLLVHCRAHPRGTSRAQDGCAASSTSSVSASSKRRPRSSQLSVLPGPLGIPVRTGPATSSCRPVAPSSMKTLRCSRRGATRIFFCRHR
jgi:hypothetical protein